MTLGESVLDFICEDRDEAITSENFDNAVCFHLAFAKHALEAGNHHKGLREPQREALIGMANTWQDLGMGLARLAYSTSKIEAYQKAWGALNEQCAKYGYMSGGVYDSICTVNENRFFSEAPPPKRSSWWNLQK